MRRVVITGLGPVSPVGIGKESFWNAIISGKTAFCKISRFPLRKDHVTQIAAEIHDFDPKKYVREKTVERVARFGFDHAGLILYYAIAGAKLAIEDSGIDFTKEDLQRSGVMVGSASGDPALLTKVNPSFPITQYGMVSSLVGCIAYEYGLQGIGFSLSGACSTGNLNLRGGYKEIRDGDADIMIVGSSSAPIMTPHPFDDFDDPTKISPMSRVNDPHVGMRPYDRDRDGFILSEGAGILILEELMHAVERGAHIYAEVVGYGDSTQTSRHFADITVDGYYNSMKSALDRTRSRGSLDGKCVYVNAHGTATVKNDIVESEAIRKVFDGETGTVFVSSLKGTLGHAQEAASSLELIACSLSLDRGIIPVTAGLMNPDPNCKPLNVIKGESIEAPVDIVVKNTAGFCGIYSTIVLKKYEQ